jgi:hypothetical protein
MVSDLLGFVGSNPSFFGRIHSLLLSLVVDKQIPQHSVELAGGLFKTVHAAFKVAQSAIREAKGLTDVHIRFDVSILSLRISLKNQ